MKKIVFALLILITVAGCKKSGDFYTDSSLYGKWELRKSSGGIGGVAYNYTAGNGNTMTFKIGGNVSSTTVTSTGTTTHNGRFRIADKVINGQGQPYLYMQMDNDSETQYDISLKNDTCSIYPTGWADAF